MKCRAINSAAGVILAALQQNRTAAGIALALDSAGLLMSPEIAAELQQLRDRVAELDAERAESRPVEEDPIAYALTAEAEHVRAGHFTEAARLLEDTGRDDDAVNLLDNVASGIHAYADDVTPQVRKLRALLAGQRKQTGGAPC